MMSDFVLPGPHGPVALKINLDLVERLEKKAGSLFKLADQLVQRELSLSDILLLLQVVYEAAGDRTPDLREFLLQGCGRPPAQLLSEVLLNILSPATRMGAVDAGEAKAAV